MWEPQMAALTRFWRVLRYDCRGHGNSDVSKVPFTVADLGRDLLGLLDYLRIDRAHVCGLSMGGLIAQWFTIHHPERVISAVFANTAARLGTTASWDSRIASVAESGMAGIRDIVLGRFFHQSFHVKSHAIVQSFGNILLRTPPEGYIAACTALRDADLREEVGSIRLPVLVIAGRLDDATQPEQSAELAAAIRGSQFVTLEDAAHLSNVEQPEAFNRCLLEFFERA
jgi:3-oxoadipate enol-lactonase